MFTLTRPKLGAFNPSDLLSGGIDYLFWLSKSDDVKMSEFQNAAKFEQDVIRGSEYWAQGMDAIEASYPPGFDSFLPDGFWYDYQEAVTDLNEWLQRAKPVLTQLHQGLEELVNKAVADGKLPPDTWSRLNAEAQRRGLSAIPILAIVALLAAALVAGAAVVCIGYFGPSWIRAFADADVIREEGAAKVQAFINREKARLESETKYNNWRISQGLAPVQFEPIKIDGRSGTSNGGGLGTGIAIGGGAVLLVGLAAIFLLGGKKGD